MKTSFLDANIFLRYLTNDDPLKADRIEALFDRAGQDQRHYPD
jgi:predicted nucleic acid-binding protein